MKKLFAAIIVAGALAGSPAYAGWGGWAQCMAENQADTWLIRFLSPAINYGIIIYGGYDCLG